MKIAIICDTHFGVRNDHEAFRRKQKLFIDYFFDYLKTNKISRVLHGGDLYDRRKYINFVTQKFTREEFLERFDKEGIQLDMIPGNHDVYYKDTNEVSGLTELVRDYKWVNVHTSPVELKFPRNTILMLPWISPQNEKEVFDAIKKTNAKFCLGHLDVIGFDRDKTGNPSDHGVDRESFSKFDWVGSGHYHHRSSKDNIHYLGSAFEFTWVDYNSPKGFTIFDTDDGKFEFVNNPFHIFKVYEYNDSDEASIQEELLKSFGDYNDCHVKVRVVSKKNEHIFDMIIDKITKAGAIKVAVIDNSFDLEHNAIVDNGEYDEIESTPTLISNYIDGLEMPAYATRLKAKMNDLYQQALQLETID
jgi:DNA repair exonuclease SbcCD nuclease subunit